MIDRSVCARQAPAAALNPAASNRAVKGSARVRWLLKEQQVSFLFPSLVLMCPIVSVSVARSRFYRASASRSSSLHKAPNRFLSLPEQSLSRVLEDDNGQSAAACARVRASRATRTPATQDRSERETVFCVRVQFYKKSQRDFYCLQVWVCVQWNYHLCEDHMKPQF